MRIHMCVCSNKSASCCSSESCSNGRSSVSDLSSPCQTSARSLGSSTFSSISSSVSSSGRQRRVPAEEEAGR